jgi:hypothetical protein
MGIQLKTDSSLSRHGRQQFVKASVALTKGFK